MTGPIHWARGLTRLPFIGTRQRPSPKGVRCQCPRRARRHQGRAELPPNPAQTPDRASDRPNDSVSGLTCQSAAPLRLEDRGSPAPLRACRSTPRLSNAFLAGSAPPTCSGRPSPEHGPTDSGVRAPTRTPAAANPDRHRLAWAAVGTAVRADEVPGDGRERDRYEGCGCTAEHGRRADQGAATPLRQRGAALVVPHLRRAASS